MDPGPHFVCLCTPKSRCDLVSFGKTLFDWKAWTIRYGNNEAGYGEVQTCCRLNTVGKTWMPTIKMICKHIDVQRITGAISGVQLRKTMVKVNHGLVL